MTRKIAMTTIRTVLTMLNSGFSYCKIRHHTGASNGFINKLASVARPDLEAFLKLSDEEIYERVYPKTPNSHCEPDWKAVNDLLQEEAYDASARLRRILSCERRTEDLFLLVVLSALRGQETQLGTSRAIHQFALCCRRCYGNRLRR